MSAVSPQIETLLHKSAQDEATLQYPVPSEIFLFHVQQSIEKLLKALIAACNASFEYTHNIRVLLDQLIDLGETLPPFNMPLAHLSEFAVRTRYEARSALSDRERDEYLHLVVSVREFVTSRISELRS